MDKLLLAIDFAAKKHRNQRRKDSTKTPYINHPIDVCNQLAQSGVTDVDTLCAAVLHDTIEDTGTTDQELITLFGENVASIVRECTDDKSLPKIKRKQLQLEHAKCISTAAKLVKLADKYSNISDLLENPPVSWSKKEIYGYATWCYAIFLNLKGVNESLEKKLMDVFEKFGINNVDPTKLDELLNEYYASIKNSEI